jgi:hypothetical protein
MYRSAAQCSFGKPDARLQAAKRWAQAACIRDSVKDAMPAYEALMMIIPRFVWLGNDMSRRYENLSSLGASVSEAAAAAVEINDLKRALEWLEQGRMVICRQILSLRDPLDELQNANPKLAKRMKEISRRLERKPGDKVPEQRSAQKELDVLEREASARRRLVEEREELIEQARAIPNF